MATSHIQYPNNNLFNNVLLQMPLPSLVPTAYQVYDHHTFWEVNSVLYYPNEWGFAGGNGFNGMAANTNMVLTYDGATLRKWSPSGAFVQSISLGTDTFKTAGVDIDCNGNIYVGHLKQVNVYDSTLKLLSTIQLNDTVIDLRIGNNKLYACGGRAKAGGGNGNGFVQQIDLAPNDTNVITMI